MRAYLGLGANVGAVRATLVTAVSSVEALGQVVAVSGLYHTAPRGVVDQPDFLNAAVALDTAFEPVTLLAALQGIERLLGRLPGAERYGPRTADLDILAIAGRCVDLPELQVPHLRLHERRFALQPLADIAPQLRPWEECDDMRREVTVRDLLETVLDQEVEWVEGPAWADAQVSP